MLIIFTLFSAFFHTQFFGLAFTDFTLRKTTRTIQQERHPNSVKTAFEWRSDNVISCYLKRF